MLAAAVLVCAASCTDDPAPAAFTPPYISEVTAEVQGREIVLRCETSGDSGRISGCGFRFGVKGETLRTIEAEIADGAFECRLDSLSPGVKYQWRAWISSGHSAIESQLQEIEVQHEYPAVGVISVTDMAGSTATVQYDITNIFSGELWSCGICWGETSGPDINTGRKTVEDTGYGSHTSEMDGLKTGKTYHVRAYAVTVRGVSYGEETAFRMPVWFEDPVLREHMLSVADSDADGYVSVPEAAAVTSVQICSDSVSTLAGIEWCTGLTALRCAGSVDAEDNGCGSLTEADFSAFPLLEELDLSGNKLRSLTLAGTSSLRKIDLSHNKLISADLSGQSGAEDIDLSYNSLTAIDLSACTSLRRLDISGNDIWSPTLPETESLEELCCSGTKISDLNGIFRQHRNLKRLEARGMLTDEDNLYILPQLERLDCSRSQITALNIKYNTALTSLSADDCRFHSLDINRNAALTDLHCVSSRLDTLYLMEGQLIDGINRNLDAGMHIASNTALVYSSKVTDETFNSYLLSQFDDDGDGVVSAPEARGVTEMRIDSSKWPGIRSLHGIGMFSSLRTLDVSGQELEEIDISGNPDIETLIVDSNPLASLDLSSNKSLRYLYCQAVSSLTSIDLSSNTLLRKAYFMRSGLTGTLDLSACLSLSALNVLGTSLSQVIVPDGIYINISAPGSTEIVYK